MTDAPIIVSTIDAPEGQGWTKIEATASPVRRETSVKVAIRSDGSLAVLIETQHLYPPQYPGAMYDKGHVVSKGYDWRPLAFGAVPFPFSA